MVRPDPFDPTRVVDQPHPSDAAPPKQRTSHQAFWQYLHISVAPNTERFADLDFDTVLGQVLSDTCLATSATAAAIALKAGEEMICRAAVGPNAPEVGARLDVTSGLSGACVRTAETQYCEDTETDPRVNVAACRRLQVRSVLVLPLLDGGELLGVYEIFSPHADAFGNHDLQNLQTLAQVIVQKLREPGQPIPLPADPDEKSAIAELAAPEPEPETASFAMPPAAEACAPVEQTELARPPVQPTETEDDATSDFSIPAPPPKAEPTAVPGWADGPLVSAKAPAKIEREKRTREWGTSLLTSAVIALAVVLGWTVGRPGWERVTGGAARQAANASLADSAERQQSRNERIGKDSRGDTVESANQSTRPKELAAAGKGSQAEAADGLVVYQNGKVIFRQKASAWQSPQGASQSNPATVEETLSPATIFLSPQLADARLVVRVEPVYPDQARQMHIQGEVMFDALIGKDGSVRQLRLVSGDLQLATAAADAVRQWRFRPYQTDGRIQEFSTLLSVNFRLH